MTGTLIFGTAACTRLNDFRKRDRMLENLRAKISYSLAHRLYRTDPTSKDAGHNYLLWFYNTRVWQKMSWMGVPVQKTPSDMWNYQEILFDLKPNLVVEFGSCYGGSALFFSHMLRAMGRPYKVLSVDVNNERIYQAAKDDKEIHFLHSSSADPSVAETIGALRKSFPGPIFAILDSDHSKRHVLAEMMLLRPLLVSGDYMVVEDSCINGHPVLPHWGDGPFEAVEEYMKMYPEEYSFDTERENKFGFTFAPRGFLVRK